MRLREGPNVRDVEPRMRATTIEERVHEVCGGSVLGLAAGSVACGKAPPSIPNAARTSSATATQLKRPVSINDTPSARGGSSSSTSIADEHWLGRAVHSSEGEYLGDVAALNEDDQHGFYVELGGFLALGGSRIIKIASDELLEVHDDRIMLLLTELEAKSLPTADSDQAEDL